MKAKRPHTGEPVREVRQLQSRVFTSAGRKLLREVVRRSGPPIIILGAHRSGTSLVARMLRSAGVYMGRSLDANSEDVSFQNLNRIVLNRWRAQWMRPPEPDRWDRLATSPASLLAVVGNLQTLERSYFGPFGQQGLETPAPPLPLARTLSPALWSRLLIRLTKLRPVRPADATPRAWGWKDPRNTLTLPVWKQLFPDARVIYVVRERGAAARSLQKRCLEQGDGAPDCRDLERCLDLVDRYESFAIELRKRYRSDWSEVHYEEICAAPRSGASALLEASGMSGSEAVVTSMARIVRP